MGDLGLVGRVGRQELRALGDRVDDRRHVVVVHPSAEETGLRLRVGVARGERREKLVDLGLALAVGQIERAVEPDRLGNLLEQIADRIDPDLGEHLPPVGVRC